jgi:putative transposase
MALIDRQYLVRPYYGSRRMAAWLATQGHAVNRTDPAPHAAHGPGGDLPATEHEQGASGAQGLSLPAERDLDRVGQSRVVLRRHYIPMAKGFIYLVVIMDWVSRAVLAWRLSNTLGAEFCVEALEEALSRYGRPEIFNTDQGSQFTSDAFTGTLKRHGVRSAWTARATAWTTSSSNGCGAA